MRNNLSQKWALLMQKSESTAKSQNQSRRRSAKCQLMIINDGNCAALIPRRGSSPSTLPPLVLLALFDLQFRVALHVQPFTGKERERARECETVASQAPSQTKGDCQSDCANCKLANEPSDFILQISTWLELVIFPAFKVKSQSFACIRQRQSCCHWHPKQTSVVRRRRAAPLASPAFDRTHTGQEQARTTGRTIDLP